MRFAIVLFIAAAAVCTPPASGQATLTTTTAARALRPGELVVLTATSAREIDELRVRAFGRDIPAFPVDARRWRALVGIDVDVRPGKYTAEVEARSNVQAYRDAVALLVRARAFATRRLTVDPSFVTPPADVQPRIAEEARLLEALWKTSSPARLWNERFVRPVPGRSSSRFGARSIFNGEPRSRHLGEDLAGPEGTPVLSPNAGRVALAQDLYFSGNTVVVDHGLGLFSLLAHLSAIDVKQGDEVTAGQQVGRLGATGRVTGPHLHWSVRLNGARIDPMSLLATLGAAK